LRRQRARRPRGDGTTFRVHGGGFILGRKVNEFGIARTMAKAVRDAGPPAESS